MSALVLPNEPIDGHEVVAWSIEESVLELCEHRWRYHVKRSCIEVIGLDGAEWINDWEVIRFGRCQGRITGWLALIDFVDDTHYFDVEAARSQLKRLARERVDSLRQEQAELEVRFPELLDLTEACADLRRRLVNIYHLTLTANDPGEALRAVRAASSPGAPAPRVTSPRGAQPGLSEEVPRLETPLSGELCEAEDA